MACEAFNKLGLRYRIWGGHGLSRQTYPGRPRSVETDIDIPIYASWYPLRGSGEYFREDQVNPQG